MEMSRRTMLKAATAATGAALAGSYGFASQARAATAVAGPPSAARVGATVTQLAYKPGTSLVQAMADFNAQVGRNFEVAKRYYQGVSTWPVKGDLGVGITSLVKRGCRGLLCFQPRVNGDDLTALKDTLHAIKKKLTDVKVTLWQEQGIGEGLTAAEFVQCYKQYQPIRKIFPLFVDFSGSHPTTWAAYNPGDHLVDGFAVDYYASVFAKKIMIDPIAELANDAGKELGIWEIGNCADPKDKLPSPHEVVEYFGYLKSLQGDRLKNGHLVGDMAWYNGPHQGVWKNTISGTQLSADYQTDRAQLDMFFDTFNGVR
jgi:hypothetical protein